MKLVARAGTPIPPRRDSFGCIAVESGPRKTRARRETGAADQFWKEITFGQQDSRGPPAMGGKTMGAPWQVTQACGSAFDARPLAPHGIGASVQCAWCDRH